MSSLSDTLLSLIQIIGFDCNLIEQQHKLSINNLTLGKPNLKACEIIVHFLLSEFDAEQAQKAFRTCWPIFYKEQSKEFKDVVLACVNELHRRNDLSIKIPTITRSILISPNGYKFYELLVCLAQLVLYKNLVRFCDQVNFIIPKVNYDDKTRVTLRKQLYLSSKILKRRALSNLNELNELTRQSYDVKLQQNEYCEEKILKIRDLLARKEKLQAKIKSNTSSIPQTSELDKKLLDFKQIVSNFHAMCSSIDTQKTLNSIQNFINSKEKNLALDSTKLKLDVSPLLLMKAPHNSINNIYTATTNTTSQEKQQLNLTSLAQLYNVSVLIHNESLQKLDKSKLAHLSGQFNEANANSQLHNTFKDLKQKLDLLVPIHESECKIMERQSFSQLNNVSNPLLTSYFNDYSILAFSLSPRHLNRKSIFGTALELYKSNKKQQNLSTLELVDLTGLNDDLDLI